MPLIIILWLLLTFCCVDLRAATVAPEGKPVVTEHVRAELLVHAPQGLQPGKPIWLGLALQHAPGWHTYWKNPGDSGLPTTLAWQLPPAAQAGDVLWPTPQRLPLGPLVNYGYDERVLLPVPLNLDLAWQQQDLQIGLRADWLVCKESCVPESGDFMLRLRVGELYQQHAALFDAALAAQPRDGVARALSARFEGQTLLLSANGLPPDWQGQPLQLFAEQAGVIDHAAVAPSQWQGNQLNLRVALSPQRTESPNTLPMVLNRPGQASGIRLVYALSQPWPAPDGAGSSSSTSPVPATAAQAPGATLAFTLLLAMLGGLLLNLMPCVFPVLSLKVLSFAQQADDRRALLLGGLAYTAGVLLSLLLLAALLLALRASGAQLGWGFQLQSPWFVAGLGALFTLIGLNLLGLFEVGSWLPGDLAARRLSNPLLDHGLTGVLAVAVASPCSAPFMGAALGAGLTLPAPQALAVFMALGVGLAAPYLAACLSPRLARRLPRPGPWMAQFKVLLAFPMFATVLWLAWVLGQQVGLDGMVALLGCLLALSLLAWVWTASRRGGAAAWTGRLAAGSLLMAACWWLWPVLDQPPGEGEPGVAIATATAPGWQVWSGQLQAQAQAAGRPVLVDFTAAWCVTCQYNKRTTLSQPALLEALEQRQVLLLRADWTRRDPLISAELNRLGRSAVPVYALYGPGSSEPKLLSEILTAGEIQDAMAAWPNPASASAPSPTLKPS